MGAFGSKRASPDETVEINGLQIYGPVIEMFPCLESGPVEKCLTDLVGLPSNSASPSDTWIGTLDQKTSTMASRQFLPSGRIFFKVFLNPKKSSTLIQYQSEMRRKSKKGGDSLHLLLEGLQYEHTIYKDLIEPLYAHGYSKNVVQYLFGSTDATFSDLTKIIVRGARTPADEMLRTELLAENLVTLNLTPFPSRKFGSTQTTKTSLQSLRDRQRSVRRTQHELNLVRTDATRYEYMVTEGMTKDTITVAAYFDSVQNAQTLKAWQVYELCGIWFQCLITMRIFRRHLLAHNDLHLGNIWMIPYPELQWTRVGYEVDGERYVFFARYRMAIYDYDRAFFKPIGPNSLLTKEECTYGGQCNALRKTSHGEVPIDVIKFFGYFMNCNQKQQRKPLTVIRQMVAILLFGSQPTERGIAEIDRIYASCFVTPAAEQVIPDDISSMDEIVASLAEIIRFPETPEDDVNTPILGRYYDGDTEDFQNGRPARSVSNQPKHRRTPIINLENQFHYRSIFTDEFRTDMLSL